MLGVRAHDYPAGSPRSLFTAIAKDRWQAIQLAPMKALSGVSSPADLTDSLAAEVQSALRDSGLSIAVYGAYVETSLADEAQRQAQVDIFLRQMPFAKAIGSACMGTETTPMEKQPGLTRAEALGHLRRSLESLLAVAQAQEITVAVEPVVTHALSTPELTRQLLDDMQSPWLKTILDPVNLLSPETLDQQPAVWQRAFDAFGGDIIAIHIKGAVWPQGQILPAPLPGSQVDYASFAKHLQALGRDIPLLREEALPALADEERTIMEEIAGG